MSKQTSALIPRTKKESKDETGSKQSEPVTKATATSIEAPSIKELSQGSIDRFIELCKAAGNTERIIELCKTIGCVNKTVAKLNSQIAGLQLKNQVLETHIAALEEQDAHERPTKLIRSTRKNLKL